MFNLRVEVWQIWHMWVSKVFAIQIGIQSWIHPVDEDIWGGCAFAVEICVYIVFWELLFPILDLKSCCAVNILKDGCITNVHDPTIGRFQVFFAIKKITMFVQTDLMFPWQDLLPFLFSFALGTSICLAIGTFRSGSLTRSGIKHIGRIILWSLISLGGRFCEVNKGAQQTFGETKKYTTWKDG